MAGGDMAAMRLKLYMFKGLSSEGRIKREAGLAWPGSKEWQKFPLLRRGLWH